MRGIKRKGDIEFSEEKNNFMKGTILKMEEIMTKEPRFEDMMKKLEDIVSALETGDMPLDESLKKYEEGMKLLRLCRKRLDETKRKVEVLIKKAGKFTTEPFDA